MTGTPSAVLETESLDQVVDEVPPQTGSVRVLHVEDNPADAALVQAYIRGVSANIEFDTVSCMADITVERARAADCAILDLSLPDATGLHGLIALRGMAEALPIVVLTGFDDLPLGLTALSSGAEDYLVKNHVDGYTLQRAIRYAIERRRLSIQVAATASAQDIRIAAPVAAAVAQGTHEVSVRIDDETGEYSLRCLVCAWEVERGPTDLHSWAQRSLDEVLLSHVDFGGLWHQAVSPASPGAPTAAEGATSGTAEPPEAAIAGDLVVGRRDLFSVNGWLKDEGTERSG